MKSLKEQEGNPRRMVSCITVFVQMYVLCVCTVVSSNIISNYHYMYMYMYVVLSTCMYDCSMLVALHVQGVHVHGTV